MVPLDLSKTEGGAEKTIKGLASFLPKLVRMTRMAVVV